MDFKLFDRWDTKVQVNDPGLIRYITLNPILVPKTGGRYVQTRFWKSKNNIVERLINKLMIPGHRGKKHKTTSGRISGKSQKVYDIVENVFKIIEEKTKKNPIEIFIRALENAAPREEIISIEYGGARYPQAVECAPQRRIDIALRQFVQGSYQKSFNKKINIVDALVDEILKAYNLDQTSTAIAKKLELERQADSSR
ncbi:MAG: 30S ribosomal protein S7 [archaeon GW2011_AR20]|nr:MAG: 30S ribosomal protein S7 [archaeon GW2011_AR20]MBS3160141.1 30S ribosomal protein S7 [Candidatus Woesearchaeota archaeon]